MWRSKRNSPGILVQILLIGFVISSLYVLPGKLVADEKSKCRNRLVQILRIGAITSTSFVGISFTPTFIYGLDAHLQNKVHIGHGLYFDWEQVRAQTDPMILILMDNPKAHQKSIARYYTQLLSGDYEENLGLLILPTPRDASEFLANCSTQRGVCRHKSIILKAILDELGIPAQLQIGFGNEFIPHMWVYLPDLDFVADPTINGFMSSKTYYEGFFGDPNGAETFARQLLGFNNWSLTPYEMGWFH